MAKSVISREKIALRLPVLFRSSTFHLAAFKQNATYSGIETFDPA